MSAVGTRVGWPVEALDGTSFTSILERGSKYRLLNAGEHQLPYSPLWPGFALDTAFYGTLAFLLWSAPGFVRRRVRKRRGLCVGCGYDLRGAAGGGPCPECGRGGD